MNNEGVLFFMALMFGEQDNLQNSENLYNLAKTTLY